MILMTADQAAEEFGVTSRMIHHWGQTGVLKRHPPAEKRTLHGGSRPYLYERAQIKRLVSRSRSRDRRGGRPSRSHATPPPAPAPDPTSPPSPGPR